MRPTAYVAARRQGMGCSERRSSIFSVGARPPTQVGACRSAENALYRVTRLGELRSGSNLQELDKISMGLLGSQEA